MKLNYQQKVVLAVANLLKNKSFSIEGLAYTCYGDNIGSMIVNISQSINEASLKYSIHVQPNHSSYEIICHGVERVGQACVIKYLNIDGTYNKDLIDSLEKSDSNLKKKNYKKFCKKFESILEKIIES